MLVNDTPVWVTCNDGHSELFSGMVLDLVPIGDLISYNGKIHFYFETEASK